MIKNVSCVAFFFRCQHQIKVAKEDSREGVATHFETTIKKIVCFQLLVCSFKNKDLFGTRGSWQSNRAQTLASGDTPRERQSGVRKANKSVCDKKTTCNIRSLPGVSSTNRCVTHRPWPLLAEQRAPMSYWCCCCCCWWWWWWTSSGLTAWQCKYFAHKDDRTIKTETNKAVKFILSTLWFKGSLKN